MRDYSAQALRVLGDRGREAFENDITVFLAVVRCLEVVGEAAYQMSPATRARYPAIPWADIINMRHRLIHGYSAIDPEIVWTTLTTRAPELLAMLHPAISALGGEGSGL